MKAKALLWLPKLISPRLLARKKKGGQKLFPLKNSIKEIICTDNINSVCPWNSPQWKPSVSSLIHVEIINTGCDRKFAKTVVQLAKAATHWSHLQHSFKGRSCATQLVLTRHQRTKAFDDGLQADIVFFDFSKAFDRVSHLSRRSVTPRDLSNTGSPAGFPKTRANKRRGMLRIKSAMLSLCLCECGPHSPIATMFRLSQLCRGSSALHDSEAPVFYWRYFLR